MKKNRAFIFGLFALLFLLFISCKKNSSNNTPNNTYTLNGNASGNNEVPPVTTQGTGTLSGTFDANSNTLQYSVSWSNLSGPATAAHFHGPAPAGQSAGVEVPITVNNNGNSGSATGTIMLTDAQKTELLAGNWYWNVHTTAHGAGEIRGQVTATK